MSAPTGREPAPPRPRPRPRSRLRPPTRRGRAGARADRAPGAFTGTAALVRLAARRDRVQLPVWVLALTGVLAANAASTADFYDTAAERAAQAAIEADNAVSLAFNGPASGTSIGAITFVESFLLLIVLVPLMSAMAVVRHTRQNEETGRAEMIGATVVGRHASLTAALVLVVVVDVVLAALLGLALVANDLPVAGSFLAGAAVAGAGIAFAGIAAVAAQVSESARGANGLAAAAVGVAFLLRAAGDAFGDVRAGGVESVSAWPSWLSPLGWVQQARPFAADRWELLLLPAALFAVAVRVAFGLTAHRDVGTGMLPVRPGPATAPPGLRSPLGLAWRLQRGVLAGWAVGVAVLAVSFGAIGREAEEILGASDQLEEYFAEIGDGGSLVDSFFATTMLLFGLAVAGYAVQALLRLRAEEAAGRTEPILAAAVGRDRWVLSHVVCAGLGTVALLVLAGAAGGLGYGLAVGSLGDGWPVVEAALVQVPAALTVAAFAVAAFAVLPRWTVAVSWTALLVCVLIGQLGTLLKLPQPVLDVSPFTHVPAVPAADVAVLPLVALLAVAAVVGAAGLAAFRYRDVTS